MFHLGFYLKEFFRHSQKNAFWATSYALTTVALIFSLAFQSSLQERVSKNIELQENSSYFHTLISSRENHARVARKLRDLPGIHRVEELSEKKIEAEVQELLGAIDLDMNQDFNLSYAGLKVILTHDLKKRSLELVRNYIQRLVGESQVTLGPVVKPDLGSNEKKGVLRILSEWGIWIFIALLGLFWAFSGIYLGFGLREHAYLLEQFQRRKNVAFKMMLTGSLCLMGISLSMALPFAPHRYLQLFPVIVGGCLFSALNLRSFSWKAS